MLSPRPVPPFFRESDVSAWAKRPKILSRNSAGDAGPVVGDRDPEHLSPALQRDNDRISRRGEFLRVGQEVGHDLHQAVRIDVGLRIERAFLEAYSHIVLCGIGRVRLDRLSQDRRKRLALKAEFQAAGLDLLDIEDVVDEPDEPLAVGMGDIDHRLHLGGRRTKGAADDEPESALDGGQGRAELMADGRDEFILGPLHFLSIGNVGIGRYRAAIRHALPGYLDRPAVRLSGYRGVLGGTHPCHELLDVFLDAGLAEVVRGRRGGAGSRRSPGRRR